MKPRKYLAALAFIAGGATALGQFSDGFEAYPAGPLVPQGGWTIWAPEGGDNGTVVDTNGHTGTNSLQYDLPGNTQGGTDVVQVFNEIGGQWIFSCWVYMPSSAGGIANQDGYLILLNQYLNAPNPPPAPDRHWSMQIRFGAVDGMVESQFDGHLLPLVKDQWVEYRAHIDLINDSMDTFYNDLILGPNLKWTENVSGPGGSLSIAALDCYADSVSGMLIDDVSLQPVTLCAGDITGDNKTCQADLGILLSKYGCCEGNLLCWDVNAEAANLSPGDTGGICPPLEEGITQADLGVLLGDYNCGAPCP